jgi:transcriptional regulator with XRE-family HTH domain
MSPDEIKALRRELNCTARELAGALSLEQDTVLAWERGDLFPTKHHVGMMEELRRRGATAIPRKRKKGAAVTPMALLADPGLWLLVRKIMGHPELRSAVEALAASYGDPADEG